MHTVSVHYSGYRVRRNVVWTDCGEDNEGSDVAFGGAMSSSIILNF
jgi:hypothetical protein